VRVVHSALKRMRQWTWHLQVFWWTESDGTHGMEACGGIDVRIAGPPQNFYGYVNHGQEIGIILYIYPCYSTRTLTRWQYEWCRLHAQIGVQGNLLKFATSGLTLPAAKDSENTSRSQYNARYLAATRAWSINVEGKVIQVQKPLHSFPPTNSLLDYYHYRAILKYIPWGFWLLKARSGKILNELCHGLVHAQRIIRTPPTLEDLVDPIEDVKWWFTI